MTSTAGMELLMQMFGGLGAGGNLGVPSNPDGNTAHITYWSLCLSTENFLSALFKQKRKD